MMTRETMSPAEARAALDSAAAARAQIAALGLCPPWRHAAFGAVMGLTCGCPTDTGTQPEKKDC